jgi:hypothetical protein
MRGGRSGQRDRWFGLEERMTFGIFDTGGIEKAKMRPVGGI